MEAWTQDELARRAGVGRATIERLERTGNVGFPNLLRVAATLGALETFDRLLVPGQPESIEEAIRPPRQRGRRKKRGHDNQA